MAGLENNVAAASTVNVLVSSRRPAQATISARPRTGISARRQLSRDRVATEQTSTAPLPCGAFEPSRPSRDARLLTLLPFCITPRPPPIPHLL
jgi:hypothetical protein